MWLIRPNEGVTTDALLGDAELTQFLLANGAWEDADYAQINLSLPKFDITGEADLRGRPAAAGVTGVFAPVRRTSPPWLRRGQRRAVCLEAAA